MSDDTINNIVLLATRRTLDAAVVVRRAGERIVEFEAWADKVQQQAAALEVAANQSDTALRLAASLLLLTIAERP